MLVCALMPCCVAGGHGSGRQPLCKGVLQSHTHLHMAPQVTPHARQAHSLGRASSCTIPTHHPTRMALKTCLRRKVQCLATWPVPAPWHVTAWHDRMPWALCMAHEGGQGHRQGPCQWPGNEATSQGWQAPGRMHSGQPMACTATAILPARGTWWTG